MEISKHIYFAVDQRGGNIYLPSQITIVRVVVRKGRKQTLLRPAFLPILITYFLPRTWATLCCQFGFLLVFPHFWHDKRALKYFPIRKGVN